MEQDPMMRTACAYAARWLNDGLECGAAEVCPDSPPEEAAAFMAAVRRLRDELVARAGPEATAEEIDRLW